MSEARRHEKELEKDKAIAQLVALARQHQGDVQRAGASLWEEIRARLDAFAADKLGQVQKRRDIVEAAWRVALDADCSSQALQAAADWKKYFDIEVEWKEYLETLVRRQRRSGDLLSADPFELIERTLAERGYRKERKDIQEGRLHESRRHTKAEFLEWVHQSFDLERASMVYLGAALIVSELLKKELFVKNAVYRKREYWRIAILYLVTEDLETPCRSLGFPEELPIGKDETLGDDTLKLRDLIRLYIAGPGPGYEAPTGYYELAVRVADRLGTIYAGSTPSEPVPPLVLSALNCIQLEPGLHAGEVAPRINCSLDHFKHFVVPWLRRLGVVNKRPGYYFLADPPPQPPSSPNPKWGQVGT